MQRAFIIIGILCIIIGLFWPWLAKLPIGRLPGDIAIERRDMKVFFPITTCIVISVVLTLAAWLMRK